MSTLASLLLLLIAARQCVSQLTSDQRQLLLDLHNQARSNVTPTAANMEEMEWNDELAQVAQAYSERCMFQHNPDRVSQASSFSSVGENLAISAGLGDNYEGLFTLWHDERSDYNFNTNGCSRVCGHYTQIVWATSNQLGCGATRCSTVTGFSASNALLLVCNYGPAGNFIGRSPYVAGTSCSECPDAKPFCSNNLCSSVMINPTSTIATTSVGLNSTESSVGTTNPPDLTDTPVASPSSMESSVGTTNPPDLTDTPVASPNSMEGSVETTDVPNPTVGTINIPIPTDTPVGTPNNDRSSGAILTSSCSFVFIIWIVVLSISITELFHC